MRRRSGIASRRSSHAKRTKARSAEKIDPRFARQRQGGSRRLTARSVRVQGNPGRPGRGGRSARWRRKGQKNVRSI